MGARDMVGRSGYTISNYRGYMELKFNLMFFFVVYIVISYLSISLTAAGAPIGIRKIFYKDKVFKESFTVNNKNVTCGLEAVGHSYLSPMYTCSNISVDGVKLYHGYSQERRSLYCSDCPCGVSVGEPNDVHALCKALLKEHNIEEPLIAAYVINPSCNFDEVHGATRIKYFIQDGTPVWKTVKTKNGYINTLQCSTKSPQTQMY